MTTDPGENETPRSGRNTLRDLLAVMAALRAPGTGCPWDLAQSFATIAPYTIEEAYEVADAIARGDLADLKDELGDLLFQVVYHARLAEDAGAFAFADVVDAITAKMLRRHPHVFGDETERAAGAPDGFWERIKAEERESKPEDRSESTSVLDGVPVALPGFTRAIKLQNKAAKVGFDWPSLAPVFEKMREELAELEDVCRVVGARPEGSDTLKPTGSPTSGARLSGSGATTNAHIEAELGDLLFVLANVARHLGIDPEAALRAANQKFIRRFHHIERALAGQGRSPEQSSLEEMERLWDEAKAREPR